MNALGLIERIAADIEQMLRKPTRQQYAALCYRKRKKQDDIEILLLTSRDTGRWVIPKGWPMTGKAPHQVAEREAYEEAGVKGKIDKTPFGNYTYLKTLNDGRKVNCRVQVHVLQVKDMLDEFPEKEARRLEWVSCREAASRVNEPELKLLIELFERRMRDGAAARH